MQHCIKCGNELPEQPGPGRPANYCSETCRRLVEYELRRIDRRLGAYELELRELLAEPRDYWGDDRPRRIKTLRGWIRADEDRLRVLAGGKLETKIRKGNDDEQ